MSITVLDLVSRARQQPIKNIETAKKMLERFLIMLTYRSAHTKKYYVSEDCSKIA